MTSKAGEKAAAIAGAKKPAKRPGVADEDLIGRKDLVSRIKLTLRPRIRELRFSLHLMAKSATSIAGVILIVFLVILAMLPFLLAEPAPGADPYVIPKDFLFPTPQPPQGIGGKFPLGTGENAASTYYGIVWGARISMAFAIQVVAIGVLMGTIIGLVSGYKGGVIDEIIMRVTDIFLSIPSLILVMAIAAVLGRGLGATKLALLAVWWSGYTRLIRGQVLYTFMYALLIIFFCYFYTAIVFNPVDLSDNMKKYGGFIPGIRPGNSTSEFLDYVMTRITLAGAIFIAFIAIFPDFIMAWLKVPYLVASFFGGTGVLIIVGVMLDTLKQIESHLLTHHYEGFIKSSRIKGRK